MSDFDNYLNRIRIVDVVWNPPNNYIIVGKKLYKKIKNKK